MITRATLDLTPLSKPQGHKFTHGHALVLSGGPGRTGAARLAARAALRVGVGLVTLGVPPAAQLEAAGHLTSIMLARVPDAAALESVLEDVRISAVCVGPNFGLTEAHQDLIAATLRRGRPTVLDADALTLLAGNPALFDLLHPGCVLTPHAGEFTRLFGDLTDDAATATRDAAARAGCTVLLKGAQTHVATPDGSCALHDARGERAVPWLATAGAGDVLAGIITGLLARGFVSHAAAGLGAFLHAEAAHGFGPGLIAEDLPDELPNVFRALGV